MSLTSEILELLQRDATLSHKNVAAMIGTDEETVSRIVRELEQSGTILRYVALVNTEVMENEPAEAMIELKVLPQRDFGYDDLASRIYKYPQVEALYLVSGTYDLLVKVAAPTMKDISKFVWEKLAVMDGVTSTSTVFIMRKYKENNVVLVREENEERLVITP